MALTKVNTDLLEDGGKLDGIEASADVTDTANVTAAGALMDSELTSEASVKALNQGVATTDSPTFAALTSTGEITANGGIALGDNDKATFGAGDDLQLYHNGGSGNYIDSVNKDLYIRCNLDAGVVGGDILLQPKAGENSAVFKDNGAVDLYYDNVAKFSTTSTGIDVTGAVNSDTLDVTGSTGTIARFRDSGNGIIDIKTTGTANSDPMQIDVNNRSLAFATNNTERMRIDSSGDLNLVNTGLANLNFTTDGSLDYARITGGKSGSGIGDLRFFTYSGGIAERMRIDSSGNVGIGTSSPSEPLTVLSAQNHQITAAYNAANSTSYGYYGIKNNNTGNPFYFNVGGSERMRIDASGNVGIGISNPSDYYTNFNDLVLGSTSTHSGMTIASGTTHDGTIAFADGTSGTAEYKGYIQYNHEVNTLTFGTDHTTRMTIDSSGRVTMPYQPTWGASSLSNTSASGGTTSAGTLVFSGVLNNNGNHYSNSTGLFTAPVAGQYFVTFSGLYDDSYSVTGAVYIRRNNANLYRAYHQNSGSSYLQISMSGVVECSAGDTISIYSDIAGWHIGGETSFSGFLIG